MRESPLGRSWPWAVSLMMGPASTPAAARAANPASPHGKTFDFMFSRTLKKSQLKGDSHMTPKVLVYCHWYQ